MNQMVAAVFICFISIFATMLTVFFVGEVVDRFQDKASQISIDYGDVKYPHMASAVNNVFKWVFSIPVFFCWVWIVWMFKVSIFDHEYTKREDENFGY